jgi:hypothetical protein
MMIKSAAAALAVGVVLAILTSCRQSDLHTTVISVPGMSDALAVRIVTNAALDQVVGRYDGIQNETQIDLAKGVVLYHETARLADTAYQRKIEARTAEVGFPGRILAVGLNPPKPVPTVDGPKQMWPNRVTAVIHVPNMKTARDANIVVSAIAYARLGGDSPRVHADAASRSLRVTYQGLFLSLKNIEQAIACAGYAANNTPAMLGQPDSPPEGWLPVIM